MDVDNFRRYCEKASTAAVTIDELHTSRILSPYTRNGDQDWFSLMETKALPGLKLGVEVGQGT